jgi:2-polyprenyl-6-methoxyphenol hydroxylase-like FAD-dependent oxidoreductase
LISGGGIAGLTLAFWLKNFGFEPTVVEKRSNFSDRGYMIDFYGSGFDVAEKMGLLDPLASRHYPIPNLDFVDRHGKVKAVFQINTFRKMLHWRHYNFMRGDLEGALYSSQPFFHLADHSVPAIGLFAGFSFPPA